MSGSASLTLEQQVLGHTLGYAAMPFPGSVYVALCAMAPVPSATIAGAEVSGGGYTRMPAGFALLDTPSSIAANNTTSVEFPSATADWGTVGYFELWDAASGGNRLYWGTLLNPSDGTPTPITVMASDIVRFSPGMLGVEVGASSGGTAGIGAFLPLAGGVLTGPLTLAGTATSPMQAVPLTQLNTALAAGSFLPLAGGTMTGPLTSAQGGVMQPGTVIEPYQNPNAWALGTPNDAGGMGGSMTIRGQPYGYYDTATLLSIVATTLPLTSSRAGIAAGFENGVSAIAGYGSYDTVNIYSGVMSTQPPLVLHNVTYDTTHVFPHPPLMPSQIAVLRNSMYVLTNSIDTTVSTTPSVPNGTKPENHYAGLVTGWASDGTSITVSGWTVPGSGHTAANQIPPVGTLDPGAANATAYFGSPTNIFGGNFMAQHNPAGAPDSRTKSYQGIEFDFQNYGTVDYEMSVAGLSLDYWALHGAKPTANSYAILTAGFPIGLSVTYGGLGLNIACDTAMVSGVFNINHWWSPQPWSGSPITTVLFEAQGYIDTNLLSLKCWTSRDSATSGWPSASVHLGVMVDGPQLSLASGSPMAQIVWNPQGYQGGLQLQTAAGIAGLTMDDLGTIILHGQLSGSATTAYIGTVYAERTTIGGFIGSIQTGGTTPSVVGMWNQNGILYIGQGHGDDPGTAASSYFSIDLGGNVGVTGRITYGTLPANAANDAAAATAGVPVGGTYRNGSVLQVRVA